MMVRAILNRGGMAIAEFPIEVDGPGDFEAGVNAAYRAFRTNYPDVSLFDDDVSVTFDKVEASDAQRP